MKLKTLLFVLLTSIGMVQAQDTIRSLVITEACLRNPYFAYLELTNMGDENVQLGNFKIGNIEPWGPKPFTPRYSSMVFQLPEKILAPGESFLIATVYDYEPTQHAKGIEDYSERLTKEEMLELADIQYHMDEGGGEMDSVTNPQRIFSEVWNGRNCFYVQQYFENGDSVVIDQVNGVFDGPGGLNQPFDSRYEGSIGYNVAGVSQASNEAYLVRRFSVKQGNLDFATARGVGIDDSEWIAIRIQGGLWRKALWTVGNHVNAKLDENTLESDVIKVDFANKTLTLPWGIRRNDDIMNYFVKKPGIGWNYHRAPNTSVEDSLSFAAKTGDKLELFVCGEGLDIALFEIIVEEPTADVKLAVPKLNEEPEGNWRDNLQSGIVTWPRITRNESGIDTIWGEYGGIPFQTRIDSLLDRIEIPSNAAWELVTVDGLQRPDIKEGDIFKVIAENGTEKEYYISVNEYRPSHNALLSAITWPDIPDFYRDIFGWNGDTIPSFGSNTFNYKVTVPLDVDGIPGLIAKTEDLNAKVEVVRASSLSGTMENRTIKFIVTAEDDTTVNTYNVELIKEKSPADIQPFNPDPFISEFVFKNYWANSFMEIYNPGNQPVDLSNYMFVGEYGEDPVFAVANAAAPNNFRYRYKNYVPGYKYTNQEAEWTADPGILEPDLNVSPIVLPGEVFVMADIRTGSTGVTPDIPDIEFNKNPWGASIGDQRNAINHWAGTIWMLKILNDSITRGLKAPKDINDFELIDVFSLKYAGYIQSWRRLPEIWKGNPLLEDSQKGEINEPEWNIMNSSDFNENFAAVPSNIGQHFFIPPTHYMSTISSVVYKVSDGYSMNESIKGTTIGTTVNGFISNLIKSNEKQTLTVASVADGSVLGADALLSMNDTLIVLSADSTNTTKYILDVSEEGLSSNALLTSVRYDIKIESEPKSAGDVTENGEGTIAGFEYGTSLNTLLVNIDVPPGANLSIINGQGAYVSLKTLNFDTSYVSVTVNDNTYFDVLAENGKTRIVYQLKPEASASSAFVTSDVYNVVQKDVLIEFVPRGTNVQSFLSNLVPSLGASIKLIDKSGLERVNGQVADDDKLVVTSSDGLKTSVYYISKLATEYVPKSTYLAYITSNTYMVDQVNYVVHNVSGTAPISEFYSKINVAQGATAVVVDKNGFAKTTGDIDGGDKVKVTSADGKIKVMYTFGTPTSNQSLVNQEISVYPNPTNGKIQVNGVKAGNRIRVFSSTGAVVRNVIVKSSMEVLSLENQPGGMYMIVVSGENSITARFKVIKF